MPVGAGGDDGGVDDLLDRIARYDSIGVERGLRGIPVVNDGARVRQRYLAGDGEAR